MRNRWFKLILLVLVTLPLVGCNSCRNDWEHFKSTTVGLRRTVTLYGADGTTIKQWTTTSVVEDNGGTVQFIDNNGKVVTVSGTMTVEE